ncbi:armadillo-type protein, partial [Syncephalis pseudoplumigaleata]
ASTKWKERKEALEALLPIVNTIKIAPGNYDELVGALVKRLNDTNVLVAIVAAPCIGHLAKGLRGQFATYKDAVLPPMIEKLKEKKTHVVEAFRNALDAVFTTISLADIMEPVTTGIKHKTPTVRAESCRWLTRSLKVVDTPPSKAEMKGFHDVLRATLDDSQADVRDAALEAMGTMMKTVGERAMLSLIDGMDKVNEAKMREYYDKAEVKAKATAARPAPAPAGSKPAPTKKAPAAKAPPKPKPKPKLGAAKPKLGAGPPKKAAPAAKGAPAAAAVLPPSKKGAKAEEPIVYKFNPDTVQGMIDEAFPASLLTDIANSNWKTRMAAVESVQSMVEQDPDAIHPELVIRMLAKKPGWKDNNFQSSAFSRACGALCITGMAEKLGDMKVKKNAGEALSAIAEKISLQFVFSQVYEPIKKQRAPKAQADALAWMQAILGDFGVRGLSVRDLIDFCKGMLGSTNAAVRANAISLLGVIRMFAGPEIRIFVQDVSSALLASIDAEFERVAAMAPPEPTKSGAEDAAAGGGGAADVLDELIPRVDINSQIPSKLYKQLADSNWKVRKEALDQLNGVATANQRLKPNLSSDLVQALKGRLNDTNKLLVEATCDIIVLIAKGMGKPFEKHLRIFLPIILSYLNDTKALLRANIINSLSQIADVCTLGPILAPAGTALDAEAPTLRKDLLKWLQERTVKAEHNLTPGEVEPVIVPTLNCLLDRNAEVRKAAQAMVGELIATVGFERVRGKCNSVKNNGAKTVIPIVEGLRSHDKGKAEAPGLAPPSASGAAPSMSRSSSRGSSAPNDRALSPGPAASAGGGIPRPGSPPKGLARPSNIKSKLAMKRKQVAPGAGGSGIPGSGARSGIPAPGSSTHAGQLGAAGTGAGGADAGGGDVPILTTDTRPKDVRADKDRGPAKWTFDVPRKENIQFLSDQMQPHFSSSMHSLCFSASHNKDRDWLSAISMLDDCLVADVEAMFGITGEEMNQRFMANLDLILKYLSIRLYDNGTTMQLRCMDFIEHTFSMLDEAGYRMTEYEANVFLPHFITKLGEKNDTIRSRVRASIKQMTRIYPASRIFTVILECGLKSKNARTRAESLDELGALIQRNSLTVCTPQKALPTIAAHIGDRDPAVRNGALNAILQAYLLVGSAVHKYLGRISEKDKDLLEERFRRNKPAGFDEEPEAAQEEDEPAPIFSFQKARMRQQPPSSGIPAPGSGGASGIPAPGGSGGGGGSSLLYRHRQRMAPAATAPEPSDHDADDMDVHPHCDDHSSA